MVVMMVTVRRFVGLDVGRYARRLDLQDGIDGRQRGRPRVQQRQQETCRTECRTSWVESGVHEGSKRRVPVPEGMTAGQGEGQGTELPTRLLPVGSRLPTALLQIIASFRASTGSKDWPGDQLVT